MKKIFVIGDVHGCLHTLKDLLKDWDEEREQLIFVGDLIDRGCFSPETVQFVKQLCKEKEAVCLLGNHEYAAVKALIIDKSDTWFRTMGEETINQYKQKGWKIKNDLKWFQELPLIWQNKKFVVSHAGISEIADNPLDKNDKESVLWTRSPLKNIENKIQIHGHTPSFENPHFNESSNSWNIDSAAVYSNFLTGIKFSMEDDSYEIFKANVHKLDVPRVYSLSE